MNHLYYNIDIQIIINDNLVFFVCQSIHIESSVDVLTDFATIELPRNFRNAVDEVGHSINISGRSILNFMKKGDSIKIGFGYDGDVKTEFQGYISRIGSEVPLVIECEDEMYQLKRLPKITKFIKSKTLYDILREVIPRKYFISMDAEYVMGKWFIDDMTPYEVLEELREKVGVRAYFKNPYTLAVGMTIDFEPEKSHYYNFSRNVRTGSDLKFLEKDQLYYLEVRSLQPNGSTISLSKGVKGGTEKLIDLPSGLKEPELKKWLDAKYNIATKEGFEGTLDGWCYPRTKAGDAVEIERPIYSDRHQDGKYFIEGVTIDVNGSDGIKRQNVISYKLK